MAEMRMGATETALQFLFFTLTDWLLLSTGVAVLLVSALYPFFSFAEAGVVVSLDLAPRTSMAHGRGCDREGCRSSIPIAVRLRSGSLILAEASPCGACMERFKPGDPVRILRVGGRCVAQKIPFWMSGKC